MNNDFSPDTPHPADAARSAETQALDAALARTTTALAALMEGSAHVASCLRSRRGTLEPPARPDADTGFQRTLDDIKGGGEREQQLAQAWKAADLANEALAGARAALAHATQALEQQRDRIVELTECVEASGQFAQELFRYKQRAEEAKSEAIAARTSAQLLENSLLRERARANELRAREISLVKEIAALQGRLESGSDYSQLAARILIRVDDGREIRYPIYKHAFTVGRTADNDIQISDPYVSGYHALVVGNGSDTYIEDLQSKNGVYVNSVRVTHYKLEDGDEIIIGGAEFRYRIKSGSEQPSGRVH